MNSAEVERWHVNHKTIVNLLGSFLIDLVSTSWDRRCSLLLLLCSFVPRLPFFQNASSIILVIQNCLFFNSFLRNLFTARSITVCSRTGSFSKDPCLRLWRTKVRENLLNVSDDSMVKNLRPSLSSIIPVPLVLLSPNHGAENTFDKEMLVVHVWDVGELLSSRTNRLKPVSKLKNKDFRFRRNCFAIL